MIKNTSNDKLQDSQTKKLVLPSSSILKKHLPEDEYDIGKVENPDKPENMYSNLHDPELMEQTQNVDHIYQSTDDGADSEPKYENISITKSFVDHELEPSSLYEDAEMNSKVSFLEKWKLKVTWMKEDPSYDVRPTRRAEY
ncbi:unnamed protein product [Ranitomeya imitator]|uniref:Uncharacterized protein n=1 Tax=Ranitomeya imitator TaxID=111125 RepID=A0ABN9MBW9_9NEOB|nr:unnamed protein product [Ranitomeya imitator]